MDLQLENNCYVLLQGNWIHPIAHRRHDLIWYPERAMSLLQRRGYRPYVDSVVTECEWIIAMYPRERVWMVSDHDGRWETPVDQTYGADVSGISSDVFNLHSQMPAIALDGGNRLQEYTDSYRERVLKATLFYS